LAAGRSLNFASYRSGKKQKKIVRSKIMVSELVSPELKKFLPKIVTVIQSVTAGRTPKLSDCRRIFYHWAIATWNFVIYWSVKWNGFAP